MAKLRVKKYLNEVKNSRMFGKCYGRIVPAGTLGTDELCRHIAKHGTIYTPDVVKGVVERFVLCFEELLHEGYKIKLDGLGTFRLKMSTTGADTPEEFTVNNIKSLRVSFLGDQQKLSEYSGSTFKQKANFQIEKMAGEGEEE